MPFWAKDPKIGNRMINARMETVAEKPAYRRAFERRRAILPADGYFEWYPTEQLTKAGKPRKQPYFIRPADGGVLAMAGLYEIWRDPDKADDDPTRFLWTCTVLTTSAEDSLGHIHDRMPLMLAPERYDAWLDPRPPTTRDDLLALLVPAAPGRLEAYPGLAPWSPTSRTTGPSWSTRSRCPSCPTSAVGASLMPAERMVRDARGEARVVTRRAKRPIATLVLTHGAGGGIDAPDLVAARPDAAAAGRLGDPASRCRGGSRARRSRRARRCIDECYLAVLDHLRTRTPARRSAAAAPAPARPAGSVAQVGRPGRARALLPAAPARAAGEVAARRAARRAACPRW